MSKFKTKIYGYTVEVETDLEIDDRITTECCITNSKGDCISLACLTGGGEFMQGGTVSDKAYDKIETWAYAQGY